MKKYKCSYNIHDESLDGWLIVGGAQVAVGFLLVVIAISTILAFISFKVEIRHVFRAFDTRVSNLIVEWSRFNAILNILIGCLFIHVGRSISCNIITDQISTIWVSNIEIFAGA